MSKKCAELPAAICNSPTPFVPGEANANAPQAYICLLSSMITDWRQQWNAQSSSGKLAPNFPFVYRQLHAYPSGGYLGTWLVLWEVNSIIAQAGADCISTSFCHCVPFYFLPGQMRLDMTAVLNTPATAMFISYDLGCMNSSVGNIHFMNKQEAGRRAALAMQVCHG